MSRNSLLRELEAELRAGPCSPPPRVELAEPVEVKRDRLLRLDDELRPVDERWSGSAAMNWVHGLRGRVCDLPPERLDAIALRVPQTAEIRRANKVVNREEPDRPVRRRGTAWAAA